MEVAPGVALRAIHRTGGHGIPFLFVHGLASNARLWDGVAEAVAAAGHDSLAIDQRGHGQSSQVDSGYDFATLAADLFTVVDAMSWNSVVAVGQSWGANVVLELAARYPEAVAGLGLIDGGFLRLRDEFATWPDAEGALTPPNFDHTSLDEIRAMMRSHMNGFPDSGIEAQLANFEVAGDGRVRNRLRLQNHVSILRNLWDHDPDATGKAVRAPIQVIAVDSGRISKQERVSSFQAMTGAEVYWREGHHDIHAQQPELVADLLLQLARKATT